MFFRNIQNHSVLAAEFASFLATRTFLRILINAMKLRTLSNVLDIINLTDLVKHVNLLPLNASGALMATIGPCFQLARRSVIIWMWIRVSIYYYPDRKVWISAVFTWVFSISIVTIFSHFKHRSSMLGFVWIKFVPSLLIEWYFFMNMINFNLWLILLLMFWLFLMSYISVWLFMIFSDMLLINLIKTDRNYHWSKYIDKQVHSIIPLVLLLGVFTLNSGIFNILNQLATTLKAAIRFAFTGKLTDIVDLFQCWASIVEALFG